MGLNIIRLKGDSINLCLFRDDEDAIYEYCNWMSNEEYTHFLGNGDDVLSIEKVKEYVKEHNKAKNEFHFNIVIAKSNKLIGNCKLCMSDKTNGSICILLGNSAYHNKGFGIEAIQLLLKFGFDELRLHRITLTVLKENAKAIRCYEKVGFVTFAEEKEVRWSKGRWWDCYHMEYTEYKWRENNQKKFDTG